MTALLVVLMVLVPILVAPAPVLAHEAGARTSQTIPVDVEVAIEGEPFLLFGVSRLQARVTDERGGTRVEGVIDWHDVALTGVVSENMAHGTNNLHFSYWTDTSPPFAFNLATAQMEQDGIFYYLGHGDGNHGLMVSNPLPVLVAFTIQVELNANGGIRQASYGGVRVRCERCARGGRR